MPSMSSPWAGRLETNAPVAHLWETLDSKKDEAIRAGLLRAIADGGYSPDAHEDGREILAGLLQNNTAFPSRGDAEELLARL